MKTTPILEWFRENNLAVPGHFNQSVVLRSDHRLNPRTLRDSFRVLASYHEILRSVWDGHSLSLRDLTSLQLIGFEEIDLTHTSDPMEEAEETANKVQESIDLAQGPLMKTVLFHFSEYDAVLIIIHHLAVDGVSWRILADDLNTVYTQLLAGRVTVRLPKPYCTFSEYAEAVNRYAVSAELAEELQYWKEAAAKCRSYQFTIPETYDNETIPFSLDEDSSKRLLTKKRESERGAEISALLLAGLMRAWKKTTGSEKLSISLEGHGRQPFGTDPLPLDRVVGWFTAIYPFFLDTSDIPSIVSSLSRIPNKGFGYGPLRYLGGYQKELDSPRLMTFNYLGSFEEGSSGENRVFRFDSEIPQGSPVNPLNHGETPLSINSLMVRGSLRGSLTYQSGTMNASDAARLAKLFIAELKTIAAE